MRELDICNFVPILGESCYFTLNNSISNLIGRNGMTISGWWLLCVCEEEQLKLSSVRPSVFWSCGLRRRRTAEEWTVASYGVGQKWKSVLLKWWAHYLKKKWWAHFFFWSGFGLVNVWSGLKIIFLFGPPVSATGSLGWILAFSWTTWSYRFTNHYLSIF